MFINWFMYNVHCTYVYAGNGEMVYVCVKAKLTFVSFFFFPFEPFPYSHRTWWLLNCCICSVSYRIYIIDVATAKGACQHLMCNLLDGS